MRLERNGSGIQLGEPFLWGASNCYGSKLDKEWFGWFHFRVGCLVIHTHLVVIYSTPLYSNMWNICRPALAAVSRRTGELTCLPATLSLKLTLHSIHHFPRTVIRFASTSLRMPAMSPTMTEGGIAGWKKAEGEAFSAGDILLEIVSIVFLLRRV
jgi:hypothetical protein